MKTEKLSPLIGTRVEGIDLRSITSSDAHALRALLEDRLVLFFADQALDPHELKKFGGKFGQLEVAPNLPGYGGDIAEVHYIDYDGSQERGVYLDQWHSDHSFQKQPNFSSVLTAEILPAEGGDTVWANMYAAYEALSPPVRAFCDGLEAIHARSEQEMHAGLGSIHPVVRVHPSTGRRALYVNSVWTRRIMGVSRSESRALLAMLFEHVKTPDFQVRWTWKPGSVAMWDNRFTQHYGVLDYAGRRKLNRITILDDEVPLGVSAVG